MDKSKLYASEHDPYHMGRADGISESRTAIVLALILGTLVGGAIVYLCLVP